MANSQPWAISGAAGFLGSHVVDELRRCKIPVLAIDDLSVGRAEFLAAHNADPDFTFATLDIRAQDKLTALLRRYSPAVFIHLAALHFIPAAIADPPSAVSLNVLGTQCVLTACRHAGVAHVWFASTGDVYAPSEKALVETDPLEPFNVYGLTKLMGEQLMRLEAKERAGATFVIGRLFNLYGPRETNPHFLPEVLRQLGERPNEPLRVGNLWPRRDLVPVADAARALIATIHSASPGVTTINVASGVAKSMQEVIDILGELRGQPIRTEIDPARIRPVERAHLQADVQRLQNLIGWSPHADLRRGLRGLLADDSIKRAP